MLSHFSGSLRFHSGTLPEKHPDLPEFSVDFQNFSKFWGASPPNPPFDTLLRVFNKNSKSLHMHAKNLRAPKISRFGQFEMRFGQFRWFAPPLKISPYAYVFDGLLFLQPQHLFTMEGRRIFFRHSHPRGGGIFSS